MPGDMSRMTTDHEEIRRWAEERGGTPAIVRGTEGIGEGFGVLRISFPGSAEDSLELISWDEFFDTFEQKNLAMVYEDRTNEGGTSRFVKFIDRERSSA